MKGMIFTMKKLLCLILLFSIVLTGCSSNKSDDKNTSSNNSNDVSPSTTNDVPADNDVDKNIDMIQEVKNYLLYGQSDKSSAEQLKWSEDFLNRVDIAKVYDEYLANGGVANDVPAFASYLTLNAPILDNWQELFEKNLYDSYGYNVSRLEDLGGGLYQAYVIVDGQEVPYVSVNSRTGYFHG